MAIRAHQTGLVAFAAFKVVKGLLLLLVGLSVGLRRCVLQSNIAKALSCSGGLQCWTRLLRLAVA
uniref:hypothetical protein n=1 Tax=Nitrospira cf. moscoviensis SBR1015 TaxID=96242 RepID=UPI00111CA75E|nr:hypothetical protein [Nitrospira cf. moscoviensis SBR1015]